MKTVRYWLLQKLLGKRMVHVLAVVAEEAIKVEEHLTYCFVCDADIDKGGHMFGCVQPEFEEFVEAIKEV